MKLEVKFLGMPEIKYGHENISFPFKKADALFYYLVMTKKATRDHLVNLFWSDSEDPIAKKNLRNAIYIIKKKIGVEVFVSPQRSMLELNPKVEIHTDLDFFLQDTEEALAHYKGSFLEGLILKECDNFEKWVLSQRQYFENVYSQSTLRLIHKNVALKDYKSVQSLCKGLIKIDPFDEESYRILMESYYESGRLDKSLALYDTLTKLLDEELAISPDPSTTALYELILEKRSQARKKAKKEPDVFFYGRQKYLKVLYDNYKSYRADQAYHHYLIQGEIGVGKTALINALMSDLKADVSVVRVFCYQGIEGFNLKAWDDLIEKLGVIVANHRIEIPEFIKRAITSTFPSFEKRGASIVAHNKDEHIFRKRTVENAIYELIKIVTRKVQLLLIFEDIQWLDEPSLIMLKKLINERHLDNPVVYITCRNAHNEFIEKFIAEFSSREIIKRIQLERFDEKESIDFIRTYPTPVEEALEAVVYEETEGNAFFIMEFLNNIKHNCAYHEMSSKIKDTLKHRLLNLSKDSLQLIQLASVFFEQFTVEDLIGISEKSTFEVLDLIEELENMYLVKESLDDESNAVYHFTHRKIKSFIYNDLSLSKRKILHTRIAKRFEEAENQKRQTYPQLIYHYSKSNNDLKALEYRIRNLYEYLQSSHEVFPLIKERDVFNHESIFFNEAEIEDEFSKIQVLLEKKYGQWDNGALVDLKLKFMHMTGRHYINNGYYDKGLAVISELIDKSKAEEHVAYLIKGYLQYIFYGINTHDLKIMSKYIDLGLEEAHKHDMKFESGILLRLKGLHYVLQSEYGKGESLLLESIDIMNQFKDKDQYTLNVAAAYYYMGDSNRFKGAFEEAIAYYEMAIEICENNDLLGRLTLFYTNAGHSAYNLGDELLSQRYFESAIQLYEQLDFPWRRSIAYGFLGLLHVKSGKYDQGIALFEQAEQYASKMNNPYELAVVCRIRSELELMLLEGNVFSTKLQQYVESNPEDSITMGIGYLDNFQDCYEMRRLKALKARRDAL